MLKHIFIKFLVTAITFLFVVAGISSGIVGVKEAIETNECKNEEIQCIEEIKNFNDLQRGISFPLVQNVGIYNQPFIKCVQTGLFKTGLNDIETLPELDTGFK
jgi:hypothetical protein